MKELKRLMRRVIVGALVLTFLVLDARVYAQGILDLPAPGARMELSPTFAPPILKGIKVYRNDPFRFDFILDKGDRRGALSASSAEPSDLSLEASRLIKYFLASLTVPENDLWVNLSPYEKERMVPEAFGQTEMGRDLLAQDYILKQIAASVIYPEGEVGKKFWDKVYAEVFKRFGTTNIPVDTFNKVWIIPEKATVYENKDAAFVVESHLKVMLETDYLAASQGGSPAGQDDIARNILREIVIPILEKEVNEGANFVPLRQVYNSLILATWYKRKVKASILGQAYVDQQKTGGIDIADKDEKERIWEQYVKAFQQGAYRIIKEEFDQGTNSFVPRKYFSGGTDLAMKDVFAVLHSGAIPKTDPAQDTVVELRIMPIAEVQTQRIDDEVRNHLERVARQKDIAIKVFQLTPADVERLERGIISRSNWKTGWRDIPKDMISWLKDGDIVALDLKVIAQQYGHDTITLRDKQGYEPIMFILNSLIDEIKKMVVDEFAFSDHTFQELLKNALVHGNQWDMNQPVYIYVERDYQGQEVALHVIDMGVKNEGLSDRFLEENFDVYQGLTGLGRGLAEIKKTYGYKSILITDGQGRMLGPVDHIASIIGKDRAEHDVAEVGEAGLVEVDAAEISATQDFKFESQIMPISDYLQVTERTESDASERVNQEDSVDAKTTAQQPTTVYRVKNGGDPQTIATLRIQEAHTLELTQEELSGLINKIRTDPNMKGLFLKKEIIERAAGERLRLKLEPGMGIIPAGLLLKDVDIARTAAVLLDDTQSTSLHTLRTSEYIRVKAGGYYRIEITDPDLGKLLFVTLNPDEIGTGELILSPLGGGKRFLELPDIEEILYLDALEVKVLMETATLTQFLRVFNEGSKMELDPLRELLEEGVGRNSQFGLFADIPAALQSQNYKRLKELLGPAVVKAALEQSDHESFVKAVMLVERDTTLLDFIAGLKQVTREFIGTHFIKNPHEVLEAIKGLMGNDVLHDVDIAVQDKLKQLDAAMNPSQINAAETSEAAFLFKGMPRPNSLKIYNTNIDLKDVKSAYKLFFPDPEKASMSLGIFNYNLAVRQSPIMDHPPKSVLSIGSGADLTNVSITTGARRVVMVSRIAFEVDGMKEKLLTWSSEDEDMKREYIEFKKARGWAETTTFLNSDLKLYVALVGELEALGLDVHKDVSFRVVDGISAVIINDYLNGQRFSKNKDDDLVFLFIKGDLSLAYERWPQVLKDLIEQKSFDGLFSNAFIPSKPIFNHILKWAGRGVRNNGFFALNDLSVADEKALSQGVSRSMLAQSFQVAPVEVVLDQGLAQWLVKVLKQRGSYGLVKTVTRKLGEKVDETKGGGAEFEPSSTSLEGRPLQELIANKINDQDKAKGSGRVADISRKIMFDLVRSPEMNRKMLMQDTREKAAFYVEDGDNGIYFMPEVVVDPAVFEGKIAVGDRILKRHVVGVGREEIRGLIRSIFRSESIAQMRLAGYKGFYINTANTALRVLLLRAGGGAEVSPPLAVTLKTRLTAWYGVMFYGYPSKSVNDPKRISTVFADKIDAAELSEKGGIDLNPSKLTIDTQNNAEDFQFTIDPVKLQQIQNASGVTPIIIGIHPLDSLPVFLGIVPSQVVIGERVL